MDKATEYAAKIHDHLLELFNEDCENHIDFEELEDNENAKIFLHALTTTAPCVIYCKLTGSDINNLDFNHLANRLCFEYMNLKD